MRRAVSRLATTRRRGLRCRHKRETEIKKDPQKHLAQLSEWTVGRLEDTSCARMSRPSAKHVGWAGGHPVKLDHVAVSSPETGRRSAVRREGITEAMGSQYPKRRVRQGKG